MHAGIHAKSPDPEVGQILRRENGAPTGVMLTLAQDLVNRVVPPQNDAQVKAAILAGLEIMAKAGVTSIHEAGSDAQELAAFLELAGEGQLPIRVYAMLNGNDEALMSGLKSGADGAVGSTYNFAMPLYDQLLTAFRAGDMEAASAMQTRSLQLVEKLNMRGYGPSAKTLMGLLGVECGPARLPLLRLAPDAPAELRTDLEDLGFFEWIGR